MAPPARRKVQIPSPSPGHALEHPAGSPWPSAPTSTVLRAPGVCSGDKKKDSAVCLHNASPSPFSVQLWPHFPPSSLGLITPYPKICLWEVSGAGSQAGTVFWDKGEIPRAEILPSPAPSPHPSRLDLHRALQRGRETTLLDGRVTWLWYLHSFFLTAGVYHEVPVQSRVLPVR